MGERCFCPPVFLEVDLEDLPHPASALSKGSVLSVGACQLVAAERHGRVRVLPPQTRCPSEHCPEDFRHLTLAQQSELQNPSQSREP